MPEDRPNLVIFTPLDVADEIADAVTAYCRTTPQAVRIEAALSPLPTLHTLSWGDRRRLGSQVIICDARDPANVWTVRGILRSFPLDLQTRRAIVLIAPWYYRGLGDSRHHEDLGMVDADMLSMARVLDKLEDHHPVYRTSRLEQAIRLGCYFIHHLARTDDHHVTRHVQQNHVIRAIQETGT